MRWSTQLYEHFEVLVHTGIRSVKCLLIRGLFVKKSFNCRSGFFVLTGKNSVLKQPKSSSCRSRNKLLGIFSMGISIFLFGCNQGDLSDLNKFIAEVKARPKSAIEPLPEIKVVEPFLFNPEKLRDPFVAIVQNSQDSANAGVANSGIRPDPLHQKEDLEHYPLDALVMVGTLRINGVLWGLVKAEEVTENPKEKALGTIHRVKVGNYMGSNFGKIIRIVEDKIELMEIVPDKPGTWREQEQELPLVLAE